MITPDQITLGILAGGRATRLGGADKAWLRRGGMDQATLSIGVVPYGSPARQLSSRVGRQYITGLLLNNSIIIALNS